MFLFDASFPQTLLTTWDLACVEGVQRRGRPAMQAIWDLVIKNIMRFVNIQ